jgi:hypothetical protein
MFHENLLGNKRDYADRQYIDENFINDADTLTL